LANAVAEDSFFSVGVVKDPPLEMSIDPKRFARTRTLPLAFPPEGNGTMAGAEGAATDEAEVVAVERLGLNGKVLPSSSVRVMAMLPVRDT
jgi:hypothetical protein